MFKKTAILFTLLASAAMAGDMTGSWACEVETDMGSGTPSFTLKQSGNSLSGKYSGTLGEADVTGKVNGDKFEMSFKFDQGEVVYTGAVSGSNAKGTLDLAGQAKGKFTCAKK